MANAHRYKTEILKLCENGHRTAEHIHKILKKTYLFLGIGTVYRNLTELVNEGVLMKHHTLGDKLIYEKKKPLHGHLFCQNTGMIQDVDISMLSFEGVQIPTDFNLEEIQVTFSGHFKNSPSAYCKINGKVLRK